MDETALLGLLGFVIAILVIGQPIAIIVLFLRLKDLKARIFRLEVQAVARPNPVIQQAPQPIPEPIAAPPHIPEAIQPAQEIPPPLQDQPLVIRKDRFADLGRWLRENWTYAVSALSLALAGIYFVQYGIEQGLLPPPLRVLAGFAFGLALIGVGEWLRRRFGDDVDSSTAYLPSVFSGAGLVAIFAAITAGRMMYGLYSPEVTFLGLVLTALGGLLLGWRNGPLLAAIGLLGAAAAPFLTDGGAEAPAWLYAHYLLVAALGLGIDAWRRWAWISVLALVLAQGGLALLWLGGAGDLGFMLAQGILVILTIALPERSLTPRHEGPSITQALLERRGNWPIFPTRLVAGNLLTASGVCLLLPLDQGGVMAAFVLLAALCLILLLWASEAEGLTDLAAIPAAFYLLLLAKVPQMVLRPNELLPPAPGVIPQITNASVLLLMAAVVSAAAFWRSLRQGSLWHAAGAVVMAPAAAIILEAMWQPQSALGLYPWALHVMALAAIFAAMALAFARQDGVQKRRTAWGALASLAMIALSLFILTSAAALTLALAVLLVAAVWLDRQFQLPEMGWFVQACVAVIGYRLVVDPGLHWAVEASLIAVVLSYLGASAAAFAGLWLLPQGRNLPQAVLESLGVASLALLFNALVARQLQYGNEWDVNESHWGMALHALPWFIVAATQGWRAAEAAGYARHFRLGLGAVALVMAAAANLRALIELNPLFYWWPDLPALVRGWPILDSLALAYGVPALLLLTLPSYLTVISRRMVMALRIWGSVPLAVWVITEIRRLWHGAFIGGDEIMQGELYSYTVAMLVSGAILLWLALSRRSVLLRRIAMGLIGLTAIKVFLWDAAGLSGLVRVMSFTGLGLSLAGLAWLSRWTTRAMQNDR